MRRKVSDGCDTYGVPLDRNAWDVEDWRILYETLKGQEALLHAARVRIGGRHNRIRADLEAATMNNGAGI